MATLLLTLYGDLKKLIKLMIAAVVILSCIFAYADKQRIANMKAEIHKEQSPSWFVEQ